MILTVTLNPVLDADASAIAAYFKTVPAVKTVPQMPKTLPPTGGAIDSGIMGVGLMALFGGTLMVVGFWMRRRSYR